MIIKKILNLYTNLRKTGEKLFNIIKIEENLDKTNRKEQAKFIGIIVLAIIINIFLWIFIIKNDSAHIKKIENEEIKYYTKIPISLKIDPQINNITIGETVIMASGKESYNQLCKTSIKLKEEDVISYITLAPRGLIYYDKSNWYIANVSKKFSSKEDVIKHITQCYEELNKEIKNKRNVAKENLKSWEK